MLVVRASWTEQVDDVTASGPQVVSKSDVVVRSAVAERETSRRAVPLRLPADRRRSAQALGGVGFHRMLQTFEDTHYRRVTYVPSGTTRYAEFFEPRRLPGRPVDGRAGGARHPVVRPSGGAARARRRAAAALGGGGGARRAVRAGGRSGARACASGWPARGSRPATASCSASSCSTPTSGCRPTERRCGRGSPRRSRRPTARRACGPRTRSCSTAGRRRRRPCRRCSPFDQLVLDVVETGCCRGRRDPAAARRRGVRRARPRLARRSGQPGRRRRSGPAA